MSEKKRISPERRAVAIKYDPKDPAPKVVAKGKGYVAEKIIEKAQADDIKVYEDPELVKEFDNINLGEHIPPELYEAVARILIFITDLDKRYEKYGQPQ